MTPATAMQTLQQTYPTARFASATVDVACSPHAFYNVVTDYESYADFVPSQRVARVLRRDRLAHGERFNVAMELSLMKAVRYELLAEGVPGRSLQWNLVSGDFMRENAGAWVLEELADGRTRASFHLAVVLKGWFPGPVISALVNKTCPATVHAFKTEAERRAMI